MKLILITLLLTSCAIEQSKPIPMEVGNGEQSSQFYDYCLYNSTLYQCGFEYPQINNYKGEAKTFYLNSESFEVLDDMNSHVNYNVKYKADDFQGLWNDARDSWRGDCEDYALAKMLALIELGVPQEAMGIALVDTDNDGKSNHAVLVVNTDKGAYVLDNRSDWVKPYTMMDGAFIHVPDYLKGTI